MQILDKDAVALAAIPTASVLVRESMSVCICLWCVLVCARARYAVVFVFACVCVCVCVCPLHAPQPRCGTRRCVPVVRTLVVGAEPAETVAVENLARL